MKAQYNCPICGHNHTETLINERNPFDRACSKCGADSCFTLAQELHMELYTPDSIWSVEYIQNSLDAGTLIVAETDKECENIENEYAFDSIITSIQIHGYFRDLTVYAVAPILEVTK